MAQGATESIEAPRAPAATAKPAPVACAVCGATAREAIPYLTPDTTFAHIFGGRKIHICDACGFGHAVPAVPEAALGEYYAASFDPRYFKRVEGGDWPFFDERSVSQIMLGRMFCDFAPGDGFLDVGPGVGASFFSASQLLPEPRLFGVEMNLAAIALMKEFSPEVSIVGAVPGLDEAAAGVPLKMCVTSHCLEHYNGAGVVPGVREIFERMAPGGVIVAEVPHWPLKRWRYRRNDVPHLSFFSQDALTRAIAAGGFEVVYANVFGVAHKTKRPPEEARRQAARVPGLRREGATFLFTANGPDFTPRPDGKILRVVGRKA